MNRHRLERPFTCCAWRYAERDISIREKQEPEDQPDITPGSSWSNTPGLKNVRWRADLPSTGQATPIVSAGRVFVTSHEPIDRDTETGRDIVGLCFDAATGRELWRADGLKIDSPYGRILASPVATNRIVVATSGNPAGAGKGRMIAIPSDSTIHEGKTDTSFVANHGIKGG